ncbi:MAG TPA: AmmeMemoRadiSam system protein B [Phycisphaerae bacterium]|nr:AmmeMemoRadiSam system protein B [Phycisphaerae bacterium]
MTTDNKLPAVRPIEVVPFRRDDGEIYFALHDPAQLSTDSLAISPAGYFVLAHLDGEHTAADIQAAFREHAGMELPAAEIHQLVEVLDAALLLQGDRVLQVLAERRAAYQAAPARDNRDHAPSADELRTEIAGLLARGVAAPVRDVRGIIAPHLDYARGGPCYADAYATLAQAPPADRYVILGTNHFGESTAVVATRKDFWTPLGAVQTDREFIARLESALGTSICTGEHDHAREHSVELQVHILQTIMGSRPFEIVPLLCPGACGPTGTAPIDGHGPDLHAVAQALANLVADGDRRTVLIAGADLSHVGQRFGDPEPTTPEFLAAVARTDRELLDMLERREEEAFVAKLAADDNPTRVCSSGGIFTMLQALPGRSCKVLSYHQAVDMAHETHVTCTAAVVW